MPTTADTPVRRKQLSEQLDRFDTILDGLAGALNEAVADASREGCRAAVKEIANELLSNPTVLATIQRLSAPPPPPPPPQPRESTPAMPSFFARLRAAAGRAVERVKTIVREAVRPVSAVLTGLKPSSTVRKAAAITAGVGVAIGVAVVMAPEWLSAALTGVAGAAVAVVSRARNALGSLVARARLA